MDEGISEIETFGESESFSTVNNSKSDVESDEESASVEKNISEESSGEEEVIPRNKRSRLSMRKSQSSLEKPVPKGIPPKKAPPKKATRSTTKKEVVKKERKKREVSKKIVKELDSEESESDEKEVKSVASQPPVSNNTADSDDIPAHIKRHNLKGSTLKIFLSFYKSNRPTSVPELSIVFPKKEVTAALDELIKKNLIMEKLYNKAKIFMMNSQVCDYEEEEVYESKLVDLKDSISVLKDELSGIQKGLAEIQNQMTLDELKEKIELLNGQMELNNSNIQKIEKGDLCTEKEIEEIRKKIKNYEKILKERNSIFKTVMDALCENLNKKKNELLEEMGILGD
ncbi:hypothetical protein NBO_434g0004 [Nosema bombycis CQ1]|uniref:Homologous-pairing protein 2 winged helix domain-containing protein n=1 Tax=Nosema bombycis (strain CQ1 / CVCC 102059) TaxID=578461 RepID=R0MI60_NOSB1|nr:hypothetical protein NBO_434g0004 [Nosema bombycis CQ1]|eukprot:EOB12473.1 hypothetical protein NBO_434g0004 [Nosema bombycis CQ1]